MGDGGAPSFALRDVGLLLLRLPPTATQRRFEAELRKNRSAAANYARLRLMMDRMGEGDALRLYRRDDATGEYPVARWIDEGVLPDGERDPDYAFRSDSTRKNHYTTLVMMSTPGKCCDALAERVDDAARAHFRARLAAMAGALRSAGPAAKGGNDGKDGNDGNDGRDGKDGMTWADVRRAYADPVALARLDGSPDDRLVVDWWLAGGDAFPPKRRHFGAVAVVSSASRGAAPDVDRLVLDRRGGAVLIAAGEGEAAGERLPAAVAKAVRDILDGGGGRQQQRRRWLFQSKTGAPRPVSDNTFGQQVKAAFRRLTGAGLGINALVRMYLTELDAREDLGPDEKREIRRRMMLGGSTSRA